LADFQSLIKELEAEEISIIAGSVDPAEKAGETVKKTESLSPLLMV